MTSFDFPQNLSSSVEKNYTIASTLRKPKSLVFDLIFFGKEAILPKGPATFSLKTQAAMVAGFMFKKGDKYELTFEKPILSQPTGNKENDIFNLTREYLKVIEKYIREYPGEWYLFHRLWPSR